MDVSACLQSKKKEPKDGLVIAKDLPVFDLSRIRPRLVTGEEAKATNDSLLVYDHTSIPKKPSQFCS